MDIQMVRDATGKLQAIMVNGKRVKASFIRGWNKAEKLPYWHEYTESELFTNPFSGVQVELNWLEASVYAFCLNWYKRYSAGRDAGAPIQTYDDMKYFLLDLNPDAYFDLPD